MQLGAAVQNGGLMAVLEHGRSPANNLKCDDGEQTVVTSVYALHRLVACPASPSSWILSTTS
jgi:hypothetical protein